MSKMGIIQKTLIGINLLSLITLVSGIAVASTKNYTKASGGYDYTWKQTACRVAVFHNQFGLNLNGQTSQYNKDVEVYLGPAEWTAEYELSGKQIKETWKASSWKDVTSSYIPSSTGQTRSTQLLSLEFKNIENNDCSGIQSYKYENPLLGNVLNNTPYVAVEMTSNGQYSFKINLLKGSGNDIQYSSTGSSIPQGWTVSVNY